ncbi:hypothetical protein J2S55_003877 [Streptosporangium brasiliense]|uniref:Uncharacterized protein n=1 Tax=Streptosporangium brasiliense TaxID=47480 RepID=A0ABT9R5U0_9ACTN|nr:hypothetical protein [Streptosporangium brasiliense]
MFYRLRGSPSTTGRTHLYRLSAAVHLSPNPGDSP